MRPKPTTIFTLLGVMLLVGAKGAEPLPGTAIEIRPHELKWIPNAPTPPGGLIAVLVGKPSEAGRYIVRLKFPPGFRVMPHSHPDERVYTVLEGTFHIGIGEQFEQSKLKRLPAGSLWVVPAKSPHFHHIESTGSVVQIQGNGPTATDYVSPAHDPRR